MADVQLTLDGGVYGGWTTVSVTRSVQALSGTFDITLSEREPGSVQPRTFRPGQRCSLSLDGHQVIGGWIDDCAPSYTSDAHTIRVSGRDRTGDLIDCSALNTPGEWHGIALPDLVEAIAEPFRIGVITRTDTGKPFTRFSIEQGETAFEAIDRACRMRAVLATSTASGELLLTRSGSVRMPRAIVRGENVLEGGGSFSHRDRYSRYIVKGQQPGTEFLPPEQIAHPMATASDSGIARYRPLLVVAEDISSDATIQDRATWEANVRASRSRKPRYTVQGWRSGTNGPLWWPNSLVHVSDDWVGLDRDMLIADVRFDKSGDVGTTTTMELMLPGAFAKLPEPDTSGTGGGGWM
ncbi:MAG: contractile injection system protein, VgrG/Pvc8 family [Thalassobaculaceae bacterium]